MGPGERLVRRGKNDKQHSKLEITEVIQPVEIIKWRVHR